MIEMLFSFPLSPLFAYSTYGAMVYGHIKRLGESIGRVGMGLMMGGATALGAAARLPGDILTGATRYVTKTAANVLGETTAPFAPGISRAAKRVARTGSVMETLNDLNRDRKRQRTT